MSEQRYQVPITFSVGLGGSQCESNQATFSLSLQITIQAPVVYVERHHHHYHTETPAPESVQLEQNALTRNLPGFQE